MATLEEELMRAFQSGLAGAVKDRLGRHDSPLDKMLSAVLQQHDGDFRAMLINAVSSALSDENFRTTITEGVRAKLARTLIDRFGGELEKQVNLLKSDPATRARITLAIEEIVSKKSA